MFVQLHVFLYGQLRTEPRFAFRVHPMKDSKRVLIAGIRIVSGLDQEPFCAYTQWCVYLCVYVCMYSGKTGQLINVCTALPIAPNLAETSRSTVS